MRDEIARVQREVEAGAFRASEYRNGLQSSEHQRKGSVTDNPVSIVCTDRVANKITIDKLQTVELGTLSHPGFVS